MYERYFARGGSCPTPVFPCTPQDALRSAVCIDGSVVPGSFFGCVEWIVSDLHTEGLVAHETDELHMFVGGDPEHYEDLNAAVDFRIENDHLLFSETSFVFVPRGCAHNISAVTGLKKPLLHYVMQVDAPAYAASPAEARAPAGTYAGYRVTKYAPVDGRIPDAPPGFLTFLLWIDGQKLPGAPYTESVWFHTTNDTGPEEHVHEDLDEFIAFIGSDPEHPEELNGDVSFLLGGEQIHTRKSTLVYVPRRVKHSPLLVHELEKDILHFSGGNSGSYNKDVNSSFDN
ncbi:MAG: hypothetical protein IKP17_06545 [Oscillospiraceae bacterium]|nr:hypothetical protein [Oscillospiraceae bacterium]